MRMKVLIYGQEVLFPKSPDCDLMQYSKRSFSFFGSPWNKDKIKVKFS